MGVAAVVLLALGLSGLIGLAAVKALRQTGQVTVQGPPPPTPPPPSPPPPPLPPPAFLERNDYAATCRWFAAQAALLQEKGEGEELKTAIKELNDALAKEVGQKVNWEVTVWEVKSREGQEEVFVFLNPFGAFRTIPASGPAFRLKADQEWVSQLKHGDVIRLTGVIRSAQFIPPTLLAPLNSLTVVVDPYILSRP